MNAAAVPTGAVSAAAPGGTSPERPALSRPPTPQWGPPDYMTLALSRLRGIVPPVETVPFTAACPACGNDCEWVEHREDTRMCVTIHCACREDAIPAQRSEVSTPLAS
jgi:hypothetical protein